MIVSLSWNYWDQDGLVFSFIYKVTIRLQNCQFQDTENCNWGSQSSDADLTTNPNCSFYFICEFCAWLELCCMYGLCKRNFRCKDLLHVLLSTWICSKFLGASWCINAIGFPMKSAYCIFLICRIISEATKQISEVMRKVWELQFSRDDASW